MMERLKVIFRQRLYVFAMVSLIIAGLSLLLAVKLSPWLYAINIPVKLHLQAPAETNIRVCWDEQKAQCLPLVPYLSAEKRIAAPNETADVWLSELPPRPNYTISFIFQSTLTNANFQSVELDSTKTYLWGTIPGVGISGQSLTPAQFSANGIIQNSQGNNTSSLTIHVNGSLSATQTLTPGPEGVSRPVTALLIWALILSAYLLVAIPIYLVPRAAQNADEPSENVREYPWWVYAAFGIILLMIFLLIMYAPMIFDQYDSMNYMQIALAKSWATSTGRPPGYYIFLAAVLWLSGYQLDGIVIAQVVLLTFSTTLCLWALRKWLHPLVAVLVMVGILFSPSQIYWMLSIMRESVFVSIVMLGVTSAMCHFHAHSKRISIIWLVIFSLLCALALLVRENGVILPVALLPALLPKVLKRLSSGTGRERVRSTMALLLPYTAPVLCTCAVYFGLSYANSVNHKYFAFTAHSVSHRALFVELATANFDSRSLLQASPAISNEAKPYLGTKLYRTFIAARESAPRLDQILLTIIPTISQTKTSQGKTPDFFYAASIANQIGESAKLRVPWQADAVGILRQYREFILSTEPNNYDVLPDEPAALALKQGYLQKLPGSIKAQYAGRSSQQSNIATQYLKIIFPYDWYYPLFLLALLCSLYLLRYDDPVLMTPIFVFMVNVALMLMLRGELVRFIQCLDVLLVLQAGFGLTSFIKRHIPIMLKKRRT